MKQSKSKGSEFPSDAVRTFQAAILSNDDAGMVASHELLKPYIKSVAKTYCKTPAELARFEQIALTTIARAVQRFDGNRGKPIEHFVRVAVKHAMLDELNKD